MIAGYGCVENGRGRGGRMWWVEGSFSCAVYVDSDAFD